MVQLQQYLPLAVLKLVMKKISVIRKNGVIALQQYLPLAVLKRIQPLSFSYFLLESCNSTYRLRYWNYIGLAPQGTLRQEVATVLTACGIETVPSKYAVSITALLVATVLTACGIETKNNSEISAQNGAGVATVLTACGIETFSVTSS